MKVFYYIGKIYPKGTETPKKKKDLHHNELLQRHVDDLDLSNFKHVYNHDINLPVGKVIKSFNLDNEKYICGYIENSTPKGEELIDQIFNNEFNDLSLYHDYFAGKKNGVIGELKIFQEVSSVKAGERPGCKILCGILTELDAKRYILFFAFGFINLSSFFFIIKKMTETNQESVPTNETPDNSTLSIENSREELQKIAPEKFASAMLDLAKRNTDLKRERDQMQTDLSSAQKTIEERQKKDIEGAVKELGKYWDESAVNHYVEIVSKNVKDPSAQHDIIFEACANCKSSDSFTKNEEAVQAFKNADEPVAKRPKADVYDQFEKESADAIFKHVGSI